MPVAVFELEEAMRAKPTCAFNINEYNMGLRLNNVLVNEINSALTYLLSHQGTLTRCRR
jgi:hypothetical protein